MRIAVALLLFTSIAAADEQVQRIAPRRTSCKPNGSVWLELAETDTAPKSVQTTTRLYGNGAVSITRTRSGGGATSTEIARCVPPAEMEDVEAQLKKVSSKTVEVNYKMPCTTTSTTATAIKVFGKAIFTERQCSKTALDPRSEQALLAARMHLGTTKQKDCQTNPLAKGCV